MDTQNTDRQGARAAGRMPAIGRLALLLLIMLALAGCNIETGANLFSDLAGKSPTTTTTTTTTTDNGIEADTTQATDQTQNDNRTVCAGLIVAGSCNIVQSASSTSTNGGGATGIEPEAQAILAGGCSGVLLLLAIPLVFGLAAAVRRD